MLIPEPLVPFKLYTCDFLKIFNSKLKDYLAQAKYFTILFVPFQGEITILSLELIYQVKLCFIDQIKYEEELGIENKISLLNI